MPFHLGDAFDWAQAVIEQAQSEPKQCVWCGLPLVTQDEREWQLCSYCRLGESPELDHPVRES